MENFRCTDKYTNKNSINNKYISNFKKKMKQ